MQLKIRGKLAVKRGGLWAAGPCPAHPTCSPQSSIENPLAGEQGNLFLELDLPVQSFLSRDRTDMQHVLLSLPHPSQGCSATGLGGLPVSFFWDPVRSLFLAWRQQPRNEIEFHSDTTKLQNGHPLASQAGIEPKVSGPREMKLLY